MNTREARGKAFDDTDVARCYAHRPSYAPALYDYLREIVPQKHILVDLGCGPGKIAAALADDFTQVVAIDPAIAMIDAARALYGQSHRNIEFIHARAEDVELPPKIDLVTAGTSIHWMVHELLFPNLAARTGLVAIITGDMPPSPPWQDGWRAVMTRWLARLHGLAYDETAFAAEGRGFEPWLDIAGRRTFAFTFRQRIEDYIACQHSRASWARSRMGDTLSAEFDRELDALLRPWSQHGMLTFELTSELTWGRPRATRRA